MTSFSGLLIHRDIIFFLKKRLISKIIRISSTSDVKKNIKINRPTVVCHFKNDKMLKYQYFTEADMSWMERVHCPVKFHSLEEGVDDYVRNYLTQDDPYLNSL